MSKLREIHQDIQESGKQLIHAPMGSDDARRALDRRIDLASIVAAVLLTGVSLLTGIDFFVMLFVLMIGVGVLYILKQHRQSQKTDVKKMGWFFGLVGVVVLLFLPNHAFAFQPVTGKEIFILMTSGCLTCDLLEPLFKTTDAMRDLVFDKFAPAFRELIGYALAIWILFQGAKMVVPMDMMGSSSGVPAEILKRLLIGVICMALLTGVSENNFIITKVAVPLLNAGLDIGSATMAISSAGDFKNKLNLDDPGCTPSEGSSEANPYARLNCFINAAQGSYGSAIAVGYSLMYYTFNAVMSGNIINVTDYKEIKVIGLKPIQIPSGFELNWRTIFAGTLSIVYGITLIVLYFFIFLFFVLNILDFVIKFTYIIAVSPMLIAAFVFPVFRRASTAGLTSLFNSAVNFWIQSVVILMGAVLITTMVGVALPANTKELFDDKTLADHASKLTPPLTIDKKWGVEPKYTFETLFQLLENTQETVFGLVRLTKIFFIFLMGGIFVGFMMKKASALTGEIVGDGIGGAVKGLVSGLVLSAGASAVTLGAAAVTAVATGGASLVGGAVGAAGGGSAARNDSQQPPGAAPTHGGNNTPNAPAAPGGAGASAPRAGSGPGSGPDSDGGSKPTWGQRFGQISGLLKSDVKDVGKAGLARASDAMNAGKDYVAAKAGDVAENIEGAVIAGSVQAQRAAKAASEGLKEFKKDFASGEEQGKIKPEDLKPKYVNPREQLIRGLSAQDNARPKAPQPAPPPSSSPPPKDNTAERMAGLGLAPGSMKVADAKKEGQARQQAGGSQSVSMNPSVNLSASAGSASASVNIPPSSTGGAPDIRDVSAGSGSGVEPNIMSDALDRVARFNDSLGFNDDSGRLIKEAEKEWEKALGDLRSVVRKASGDQQVLVEETIQAQVKALKAQLDEAKSGAVSRERVLLAEKRLDGLESILRNKG